MARGTELIILFADIAGSTRLYETLGDARARVTVASCVEVMTDVTRRQAGQVVKTIGDEVMSLFRHADDAAAAAVAMQEAISGDGIALASPVSIRVGFHHGPVIIDRADIYGDAVNVAAHVSRMAKPGQILATGAARRLLGGQWQLDSRPGAALHFKGKQVQTEVHELIWRAEEMTILRTLPRKPIASAARLVLTIGNTRVELGDPRPLFTLGRDERNDAVVGEVTVSRHHARVELSNGRFVLTDQSANGTFIVPDEGDGAFVHRDSAVLEGRGLLGLGAPPAPGSRIAIRYEPG